MSSLKEINEQPKNLSDSKKLINVWNSLLRLSRRRSAENELKISSLKMLNDLIARSKLLDPEVKQMVENDLKTTKEWLDENKEREDLKSDEIEQKERNLRLVIRKAEIKVKSMKSTETSTNKETDKKEEAVPEKEKEDLLFQKKKRKKMSFLRPSIKKKRTPLPTLMMSSLLKERTLTLRIKNLIDY